MVALFILVFSLSRKVNFHLFFGEIWQNGKFLPPANPCVSLANMWAFSDDALGTVGHLCTVTERKDRP